MDKWGACPQVRWCTGRLPDSVCFQGSCPCRAYVQLLYLEKETLGEDAHLAHSNSSNENMPFLGCQPQGQPPTAPASQSSSPVFPLRKLPLMLAKQIQFPCTTPHPTHMLRRGIPISIRHNIRNTKNNCKAAMVCCVKNWITLVWLLRTIR
eukprot:929031-Pelagomonas_calceolata.AAC.2